MRDHHCFSQRAPRGFTLVEILVVIAIVAVLIAMLIPALARSKDAARAIACRSNFHQLAFAFEAYANEWRDYIPATAVDASTRCWVDSLGDAGVLGPSVNYTGYLVSIPVACKSWKVYECPNETPYLGIGDPSASLFIGTGSIAGINYTRYQFWYYRTSYQMNWEVSKYSYGRPRKGWTRGPELMSPDRASLLADGQAYYLYFLDEIDRLPSAWDFPRTKHAYRHYDDQLNVLYFDGHVEGRRPFYATGQKIWAGYLFNNPP